mmetsp:Transcript_9877/g.29040  ORF Transcript_9877/g.29040 Transcript_9877/m.29040 type:complete len:454 (+) Transcript_9877:133-1494(+)
MAGATTRVCPGILLALHQLCVSCCRRASIAFGLGLGLGLGLRHGHELRHGLGCPRAWRPRTIIARNEIEHAAPAPRSHHFVAAHGPGALAEQLLVPLTAIEGHAHAAAGVAALDEPVLAHQHMLIHVLAFDRLLTTEATGHDGLAERMAAHELLALPVDATVRACDVVIHVAGHDLGAAAVRTAYLPRRAQEAQVVPLVLLHHGPAALLAFHLPHEKPALHGELGAPPLVGADVPFAVARRRWLYVCVHLIRPPDIAHEAAAMALIRHVLREVAVAFFEREVRQQAMLLVLQGEDVVHALTDFLLRSERAPESHLLHEAEEAPMLRADGLQWHFDEAALDQAHALAVHVDGALLVAAAAGRDERQVRPSLAWTGGVLKHQRLLPRDHEAHVALVARVQGDLQLVTGQDDGPAESALDRALDALLQGDAVDLFAGRLAEGLALHLLPRPLLLHL